jgi:hypothetical protein
MKEASVNESLMTHRNTLDDIKTGEYGCPGKSMADIYLLAMRCPVRIPGHVDPDYGAM